MIIENIYSHHSILPPAIQPKIFKKLLLTCTTKVPIYDPSSNIYLQIDGISMVLPLGPTISEFYLSHIKNKIFKTIITKPKTYVHYVDDIFITTHSNDKINKLKQIQEKNSALNFTTKLNINKKKSLSLMY